MLAPSSWHGATTIAFGNCGVGFAPVRQQHQKALIDLMEGVEDIPGITLSEGLKWDWESFPEYLDALRHGVLFLRNAHRNPDTGGYAWLLRWEDGQFLPFSLDPDASASPVATPAGTYLFH